MWPFKTRGVKRLGIQRAVEKEVTESEKFLRIISEVISNFNREKQLHFNVFILEDNLTFLRDYPHLTPIWTVIDPARFRAWISLVTRLLMRSIVYAEKIENDSVVIKDKLTKLRRAVIGDDAAHVLQEKEVVVLEVTLNLTKKMKQCLQQLNVISGYRVINVRMWPRVILDVITKKSSGLEGVFEADREIQTVFNSIIEIQKSVKGLLKLTKDAEEEARELLSE